MRRIIFIIPILFLLSGCTQVNEPKGCIRELHNVAFELESEEDKISFDNYNKGKAHEDTIRVFNREIDNLTWYIAYTTGIEMEDAKGNIMYKSTDASNSVCYAYADGTIVYLPEQCTFVTGFYEIETNDENKLKPVESFDFTDVRIMFDRTVSYALLENTLEDEFGVTKRFVKLDEDGNPLHGDDNILIVDICTNYVATDDERLYPVGDVIGDCYVQHSQNSTYYKWLDDGIFICITGKDNSKCIVQRISEQ